jgi:hypothetical protein
VDPYIAAGWRKNKGNRGHGFKMDKKHIKAYGMKKAPKGDKVRYAEN